MKKIKANDMNILHIGRHGENLARQVVFDLSDFAAEYGDGTAELIAQRPGDDVPYPVAASMEGNTLIWTLTAADTDRSGGYGRCELRWYVGDVLVKSKIWRTWVEPAMDTPSGTPPEPEQGWVDQVLAAGAEAKQAAERAEDALGKAPIINDNGNWFVWDSAAGEYVDTGRYSGGSAPYIGPNGNWFIGSEDSGVPATGPAGKNGEPGKDGAPFTYDDFTPEQLEALRGPAGHDGYTPQKGVDYFDGAPGKDGADGAPGKDGYTPVKNVDYFDGEPGKDGVDGKPGADGYTPVKDIDYFDGKDGAPGEKGDPFTYEDFTEEQLAALKGDPGPKGDTGESGLPNVLSVSGAEVALTLANNTETRCADAVTALTVEGFSAGDDGKAEQWGLVFTASVDGITVTVPDSLVWAVAEPVFTAGSTYWLSVVPLAGKYLAVWTEVAADES